MPSPKKEFGGKTFEALSPSEKKSVQDAYPMHISEMALSNLAKKIKDMGKFSKSGGREMPELNTSSLPDLVFAFLFFIIWLPPSVRLPRRSSFSNPAYGY